MSAADLVKKSTRWRCSSSASRADAAAELQQREQVGEAAAGIGRRAQQPLAQHADDRIQRRAHRRRNSPASAGEWRAISRFVSPPRPASR